MSGFATELWNIGQPKCAAASATAAQAAGSKRSMLPIGASATGIAIFRPRNLELVSVPLTSRSTRGRKARESSPRRLRRTVVSVSAPPIR